MNKKILLVFAQTGEASALLKITGAKAVEGVTIDVWSEGRVPGCYTFDKGLIAISNVGLHAAQMCVAKYAPFCDEVWNLGFAGALKTGMPIGEFSATLCVGKNTTLGQGPLDARSEECLSSTLPPLYLHATGYKLLSSDFPIHDTAYRDRLGEHWDLVDMEGYGIAFASTALKKPCRMWKIVSDLASPGGRELIRKHRAELAEKIAANVMEYL